MDNNYIATFENSMLVAEEAESIRDLAMGLFRPLASREVVKKRGDKKKRGFVLYADSGENIGSGAVDEFFGVVVVKEPTRNWKMTISFLEYILTEEARYSNFREIYDFECSPVLGCTALKKCITIDAPILSSRSELSSHTVIDTVQSNRYVSVEPMTAMHCDVLCDRMLSFFQQETDKRLVYEQN